MTIGVSPALGTDYYAVEELLTDEERGIREGVRAFCEKEVIPNLGEYRDQAEFPFALLPKLARSDGSLNAFTASIPRWR